MAKRQNCDHSEQYLLDESECRSGIEVNAHDCDYVDARNALIPEAMRMASETGAARNSLKWSGEFHVAMNRLAREHGLVNGPVIIH